MPSRTNDRNEGAGLVRAEVRPSCRSSRGTTALSQIEAVLLRVSFISFAYFYQGADQGTAARFDLMRALVERHTLWIDGYCGYNTADVISMFGHYYSVKAPGGSLTGLVQWVIFTVTLSPLAAGHEALYWALTTWLTIVFSTSLIVALASVAMYRLVVLFGATPGRAIVCALLMSFGTIMFPYATEMTGEPIAAACSLISFYLLASQTAEHDAGRVMLAGASAGWSVLCDFPALLIAAALALYAMRRLGPGLRLLAFAGGAAAIALLLFTYNLRAFGNPLFFSYEAYKLAGNSQFPEQAVGFVGLTYPRRDILYRILIDPQRGLFYCNPVLILSIVGVVAMWRRQSLRSEVLVIAFAAGAMILFNASFGASIVSWGGGTATGPRQIVAAIPFLVIPLAFVPTRINWLFAPLALLSVLIMLIATSVEPHFPYEYANPVRDFATPAYLRADFAYDRDAYFGGPAIVGESTAFNLGKLAHLPGPLQLLPLAAFWLWGIAKLLHDESLTVTSPRRRAVAYCAIGALFLPPVLGSAITRLTPASAHGLVGRYYRGLGPDGFPAHIERVDRQIDFGDVAQLGAIPAPSHVIWTGTLDAPRSGLYRFKMEADDSGWLTIDGSAVINDPGNVTRIEAVGMVFLDAGPHRVEVGERNLAGDASMRLKWQPPGASAVELVPSAVLSPR